MIAFIRLMLRHLAGASILVSSDCDSSSKPNYPMFRIRWSARTPVTGRPFRYVTEGHTTEIESVQEQESEHLQQYLAAHLKNPAFHYRHHWTAGDLIWDNYSAHHLAIFDYGALPHRMHRAGVMGPAPT